MSQITPKVMSKKAIKSRVKVQIQHDFCQYVLKDGVAAIQFDPTDEEAVNAAWATFVDELYESDEIDRIQRSRWIREGFINKSKR